MQKTYLLNLFLHRHQGIITPYGTTGKMIILSQFRPILAITVWDVVCLLWTYHINRPPRTKFQDQTVYMERMLKLLVSKIIEMEENLLARPTTVNLTFSVRKGRILRYFFGATIRCGTAEVRQMREQIYEMNKLVAMTRVKMMPTLFSSVPTTKKLKNCNQVWGNCSETVPWYALHGQRKPQKRRVILYSQTMNPR